MHVEAASRSSLDPAVQARQLLGDARHAFEAAAHAVGGEVVVRLRVGGRAVALRFAGEGLLRIVTTALAHLRADDADDAKADLTVLLFDTATTGVLPPAAPWDQRAFVPRGDLRHLRRGSVRVAFRIDSGTLSLFDEKSATAVAWIRDPAGVPSWDFAAPLRTILSWWAVRRGDQLAHGACVGTEAGGVLLAAPGGSGKSTTALVALLAGLRFAGDDYVLVQDDPDEGPRVGSLYRSAKVTPHQLATLGSSLASQVALPADPCCKAGKAVLILGEAFAAQLAPLVPLRAILVPRIAPDGRVGIRPIEPGAVVMALAPTSLLQLPGAGAHELAAFSRFAHRVPGYALDLAPDLGVVIASLRAIITAHAEEAPRAAAGSA